MPVEEQVLSIWIANNDYLLDIQIDQVRQFEEEFQAFIKAEFGDVLNSIRDEKALSDTTTEALKKAADAFKKQFVANAALASKA
jgi:F-type H+-transporting ATPase subunit alpha